MISYPCQNCGKPREFKLKGHVTELCGKCASQLRSNTPREQIPLIKCERCGKEYHRSKPEKYCRSCASHLHAERLKNKKGKEEKTEPIDYVSEIFPIRFEMKDGHMIIHAKESGRLAVKMSNIPAFIGEMWDCYDTWGCVRT